ncbi:hypothetical protein C0J52_03040 [Blattella germanica]|nr:hypothetical protein C0J52_03040 [Blattella germanica]
MQQASKKDPQVSYIQLSHPLKRYKRSPKEEITYNESQTPVITWFVEDTEGGKNTTVCENNDINDKQLEKKEQNANDEKAE